jgi:hypothetical protein
MFGVVSRNFVAARHPFRKWVSGCIQSTSFCHRNHFVVFLQRTCPIHYFRSKTHVWVVSRNFVATRHPFRKRVSGAYKARLIVTGTISSFFATNMPNPLLLVENSCLGWFRAISLQHVNHSENGCRGAYKARVFATGTISSFFCNEHAQSTTLGPKHMFGWFRAISLPHVTHPENGCRGAYKPEFSPPEPFLRFSQRTCPIHYFRSKTHVWGWFRAISLPHVTHSENGCRGA